MLTATDYNKGLIYTDVDGCIECSKCIHECPVLKSNVSIKANDGTYKICVDERECILCGTCLSTCIHNARHYRDDFDEFLMDLKMGTRYTALIAPAFYLSYPDKYEKIFGYLNSLGVRSFYSVGFGADISVWGYVNYIEKSKNQINIAQPCPTIVRYIEKHMPQLIPNIIPIQSPMMSLAIYLRQYMGIKDEFVFISPCVAKKVEIESTRGNMLVRHNVTFNSLLKHIKNEQININDYPKINDKLETGMGSLMPKPGGLKENIEYYLGSEASVIQLEGERKTYKFLNYLAEEIKNPTDNIPVIIDILNCEIGCLHGTGTEANNINDYTAMKQALKLGRKKRGNILDPKDRLNALNTKFSNLNINDFKCEYENDVNTYARFVPDSEIESIFRSRLMKLTDNDQHIDCAACGYKTCRDMAEAIARGINHHDNCVYYVRTTLINTMKEVSTAEERLRAIINNMPMMCTVCDSDFNVIECNDECIKIFDFETHQDFLNNFHLLSPEHQPDGSHSQTKGKELIAKTLYEGYIRLEWVHQKLNGEQVPVDIISVRVNWQGEYNVVSFLRDLRDI